MKEWNPSNKAWREAAEVCKITVPQAKVLSNAFCGDLVAPHYNGRTLDQLLRSGHLARSNKPYTIATTKTGARCHERIWKTLRAVDGISKPAPSVSGEERREA